MREKQGHLGRHGRRDHEEHRGHRQFTKEEHRDFSDSHHKKAQTFRRGRAVAFLENLHLNRSTLQRQLQDPELESIKQVISGELKATEMIIDDFIHMFQLHETAGSLDDTSAEVDKEEGKDQI